MTPKQQIKSYLATQPAPKRADMETLHTLTTKAFPKAKLWFHDGTDENGKVVSNPNIGYGSYTITYAKGDTKESFRVGLSGNTSGISIYILGLTDKTYLKKTYAKTLGKASITGYCIKFKSLQDINLETLQSAIAYGLELPAAS